MTKHAARWLLLPIFMAAAAFLVQGYGSPGDGFSAGVTAALGVLLQYVAFGRVQAAKRMRLFPLGPTIAFAGLLIMLGVVLIGPIAGEPLLTHAPRPGADAIHLGALELHTALLYDVGIALLVFGAAICLVELFSEVELGST